MGAAHSVLTPSGCGTDNEAWWPQDLRLQMLQEKLSYSFEAFKTSLTDCHAHLMCRRKLRSANRNFAAVDTLVRTGRIESKRKILTLFFHLLCAPSVV